MYFNLRTEIKIRLNIRVNSWINKNILNIIFYAKVEGMQQQQQQQQNK